jgi:hypothetical protein
MLTPLRRNFRRHIVTPATQYQWAQILECAATMQRASAARPGVDRRAYGLVTEAGRRVPEVVRFTAGWA